MLLAAVTFNANCQLKLPFETLRNTATRNVAVITPPTITLVDITNPVLNTVQGVPVTQTLNISGVNLNVNLGLSIIGTDAGLFSLSQYTISENAGTIPNTNVTITYAPVSVGSNSATLILSSSGAMTVARTLTGNTSVATGILSPVNSLVVTVENGNILINTNEGEMLEIYNSIGQKLLETLTVEGLNRIPLKARGVLLVKVGNRVVKVIM